VRIATAVNSAYDLYLSRNLKHATLVRANAIQGSYDVFVKDKLEVLSGSSRGSSTTPRPAWLARPGREIHRRAAIGGHAAGRPAAASYLAEFAKEMKTSGFVARRSRATRCGRQRRCLTRRARWNDGPLLSV